MKDPIEFFLQEEKVILHKHKLNRQWKKTGEVNDSNLIINENLMVNPNEASELILKLQI